MRGINRGRVKELISAPSRPKLLVVGDVMVDEYYYGTAERISPEAPVPVVRYVREEVALGGAANVAHNLASLGARVTLAGVVGDDIYGRRLVALARGAGIGCGGLVIQEGRLTTRKTRVVAHDQQVVRIDRESVDAVDGDTEKRVIRFIGSQVSNNALVLLSDYAKGTLTGSLVKQVITLSRKARRPVIVDPKGRSFAKYRGATIITPNLKELFEAAQMDGYTPANLERGVKGSMGEAGCQAVVVTRGREGMSVFEAHGRAHHLPAQVKEVYDVTGAGDTVIAALGYFLALGGTVLEAAYLANLAAAVVVGKPGTATVSRDEIAALLPDQPLF